MYTLREMLYLGFRYSISGFTLTDMGKLTQQDLDFLSQLGFPSYADHSMRLSSEPTIHHAAEQISTAAEPSAS